MLTVFTCWHYWLRVDIFSFIISTKEVICVYWFIDLSISVSKITQKVVYKILWNFGSSNWLDFMGTVGKDADQEMFFFQFLNMTNKI